MYKGIREMFYNEDKNCNIKMIDLKGSDPRTMVAINRISVKNRLILNRENLSKTVELIVTILKFELLFNKCYNKNNIKVSQIM